MENHVIKIVKSIEGYDRVSHKIFMDGKQVEELFNENIGYVNMVAKEYEIYGMRRAKWLDIHNVRFMDRLKYEK